MKWTYVRIEEYVRRVRSFTLGGGCRECEKLVPILELSGSPSLTRMTRDGYGLVRIKEAIRERGFFCRGCARENGAKVAAVLLKGVGDKKKKQLQLDLEVKEDKKLWTDERKFEYCIQEEGSVLPIWVVVLGRVGQCWEEGPLRDEALEILKKSL